MTILEKMKILILGSGGREHALASAYSRSKKVQKVFVAPGNGLMDFLDPKITTLPHIPALDFEKVLEFVKKEKIELVDVASDDLLAAGLVDKLQKEKIVAFGATQKASEIEWNKEWARNFMKKYKLPIPQYESFSNVDKAIAYVKKMREQTLFIKASGLALGKGVIRADTRKEAIDAISQMKSFGRSGETFLIEEGMIGEEFSLFAICDGEDCVITKAAQDHKTVFNGDKGPNTGGMGSVAPTGAINTLIIRIIEVKIIKPLLVGMEKEGRQYKGILYLGGMLTHSAAPARGGQAGQDKVKIIEFNARWGDPEAEVILPGITSDYVDIALAVIEGSLSKHKIKQDKKIRVSVAGCSKGYPGGYAKVKGKEVLGIPDALKISGVSIFGAGIKRDKEKFFANGGRVFHLVAVGDNIVEARKKAYSAMKKISIAGDNLHYRKDIGWRDVKRLTMS